MEQAFAGIGFQQGRIVEPEFQQQEFGIEDGQQPYGFKDRIGNMKGVQKFRQTFLENKEGEKFEKFGKWSVGFAYAISLGAPLLDVTNFIDLFVENKIAILVTHLIRIVLSIVIVVLSTTSMVKGWRNTPISLGYNIFTKAVTMALSLAYMIVLAVRYSEKTEKGKSDIIGIIASVLINLMNIGFLISAIVSYVRGAREIEISWVFIIISAIIGIIFSIISIIRAFNKPTVEEPKLAKK